MVQNEKVKRLFMPWGDFLFFQNFSNYFSKFCYSPLLTLIFYGLNPMLFFEFCILSTNALWALRSKWFNLYLHQKIFFAKIDRTSHFLLFFGKL